MSLKVTGTFGCEITALIVPNIMSSLQKNKQTKTSGFSILAQTVMLDWDVFR